MEIISGIHRVDGVRGANSYLVIGEGAITVIDTGMRGNGKKIVEYIKSLGRDPCEVESIVLTHADFDHSGSAVELKEMTGAKVAIHEGDALRFSRVMGLKKMRGIFTPLLKVMSRIMNFPAIKPDIMLREGDKIGDLKVIHTPGHTEGSICLYKPGELIFVGDVLKSNKNGSLELPWRLVTLDMVKAKESLRKISQLQFNILLPGHGRPVLQDAQEKVRHLLENTG